MFALSCSTFSHEILKLVTRLFSLFNNAIISWFLNPLRPCPGQMKSEVYEKRLRHGVGSSIARARDKTKQTHCDCSTTAWSSCKHGICMFSVACVAGVKRGGTGDVTFKREIKRSHFATEFNGVEVRSHSGERF